MTSSHFLDRGVQIFFTKVAATSPALEQFFVKTRLKKVGKRILKTFSNKFSSTRIALSVDKKNWN